MPLYRKFILLLPVVILASCAASKTKSAGAKVADSQEQQAKEQQAKELQIREQQIKEQQAKEEVIKQRLDSVKNIPGEKTVPYKDKNGLPDVKEFSSGGIKVLMRPTAGGQRIITAKLYIKGGISYLKPGITPAIEQMAMIIPFLSGPQGMDKLDYQKTLTKMYAGISGGDGRDFSQVLIRCVDTDFEKVWGYFSDIINNPKFDSVEFRSIKERVINSIENRTASPEAYASFVADSIFYAGHPYGRYPQIKDVEKITVSDLQNHFKNIFQKSRMFLVVVGAVDSTDIYNKVAKTFKDIPVGSYTDIPMPIPKNAEKTSITLLKPEKGRPAPTSYIIARYLAPNRNDSLYYPMMRLTSFLGGSLFREVRVERNLSYAPDSDVEFGKSSYGELSISTTLPDSAWRTAKNFVFDFFKDYILQESSMKSGLTSWLTSNALKEQTSQSQADEIGEAYYYTGSWKNAYNTLENFKKMTPETLNEAARKYLQNFTFVIYGNPKLVNKKEYVY